MKLLDAFMTQRQLTARARPLRAPVHRLATPAKVAVGVSTLVELACVLAAGGAHSATGIVLAVAGFLAAHVAIYKVESRPGSLKVRFRDVP